MIEKTNLGPFHYRWGLYVFFINCFFLYFWISFISIYLYNNKKNISTNTRNKDQLASHYSGNYQFIWKISFLSSILLYNSSLRHSCVYCLHCARQQSKLIQYSTVHMNCLTRGNRATVADSLSCLTGHWPICYMFTRRLAKDSVGLTRQPISY